MSSFLYNYRTLGTIVLLLIICSSCFKATEALRCFTCDKDGSRCDNTFCTAVNGGYCAFQQQLDASGRVLHTTEACLVQNYIRAADDVISTVGQCIVTRDPKTGLTYRTYLCNDMDLCNFDCAQHAAPMIPTISPPTIINCYSCNETAQNCFDGKCNTAPNGYCLFQRQLFKVGIGFEYRSIKRCLRAPYAITPDGGVVTAVNQCVQSIGSNGNRYFTLMCNTSDLCNADCIPTIPQSTTALATTTTSSSPALIGSHTLIIISAFSLIIILL